MKLALLTCALAASMVSAQELPDAPKATQPNVGFGKTSKAATAPSAGVTVTEMEALSHVLTRPLQIYPPLASVNKIEGDVVVEATIDPNGNVAATKLISGSTMLAPSALQFVKQWLFRPFYNADVRVPATTQLTVHYSLFASDAERQLEQHFQQTYWPAWRAGEEALSKQDYATAKQQFQLARDEAAKLGQANWQELSNALARLGAVEYRQKDYSAAEPYLLQSLQIQQNHREPGAPEIADAFGNLAQLYMAEQQFGKAEPLLQKAVEVYDAQLQKQLSPTATANLMRHRVLNLFMLASLNQQMGAGDEAVGYCDEVVGEAPRAMAKDEAILVIRTCETVYRKNLKLAKARDAEKAAVNLEK